MKCKDCFHYDVCTKLTRVVAFGRDIDVDCDNFAEDNNVPSKWISVKDGLPKLIPCDAGTAYSEAVNVLTTGRKVLTAIWDGFDWICDAEFWDAEDEEITHWTPVLLPLPQPPKGE